MSMDIGQAQALVGYVENPQNPAGVGLLTWAHYYQARILLLEKMWSCRMRRRCMASLWIRLRPGSSSLPIRDSSATSKLRQR